DIQWQTYGPGHLLGVKLGDEPLLELTRTVCTGKPAVSSVTGSPPLRTRHAGNWHNSPSQAPILP
ncbi:hypothetical protein, partial [Buttiauxella agrestis]